MTFDIGPFHLHRVEDSGILDISLKAFPDSMFGWEYGYDEDYARRPWIALRVGKLCIFAFEKFNKGFELWILGFWWIQ